MIILRRIVVTVLWVAVCGIAIAEYLLLGHFQTRYQQEAQYLKRIEGRFERVSAQHQQTRRQIVRDQHHTRRLVKVLMKNSTQLNHTRAQLAQQRQTVQKLHARLSDVQQQMDQVQGELALALERESGSSELRQPDAVELERVLVSNANMPALEGRVVSVHPEWHFVVIDLGWDVVNVGDRVQIVRDGSRVADARVERVQESICAATILPEWEPTSIRVNDLARVM